MAKGIFRASLCAASAWAMLAMLNAPAVAQPAAAPAAQNAAAPAACANLKRVVQAKMLRSATGVDWVPVQINGQAKYMVLQTEAAHSSLDKPATDDLQIKTQPAPKGAAGGRGFGKAEQAALDHFQIGNADFGALTLAVSPKPSDDYAQDKKFAGTLAGDVLGHFDIDMDFGSDTLNLFLPDHCEGKVVYWNASAVVPIPLTYDRNGGAHFPVTVDGVTFDAILDTGSADTVINMPSAASAQLKVDVDAPDVKKIKDGSFPTYVKTFHSIDLGGIAITNPVLQLSVSPILKQLHNFDVGQGPPDQEAQRPADIFIGMSVLSKLHVYLATREHKLYISAAAPPS